MPIRRRRRPATNDAITPGATLARHLDAATRNRADVTALYLSPDHTHLAVLRHGSELTIYRLDDERIGDKVAEARTGFPSKMAWSGSGHLLAFLNADNQAEILNPTDGTSLNLGDATAVAFYPDGSHAAVMGDEYLAVWQVNPLNRLRQAEFALEVGAGTKGSAVVTPRLLTRRPMACLRYGHLRNHDPGRRGLARRRPFRRP
jgi:Anaphase-promoting complex subunit 4 WD40 domain